MIPLKIKEHLDNYIHQEVYVQIAVIKGKEKVSTKVAIESYFNSNHFRDLSEGRPYDHFIDGLNDKCLIKLINSPMKDKETNDEVIIELQKKLKKLSNDELENTELILSPILFITSGDRIIFNGQQSSNKAKPKFSIIYTEF